MLMSHLFMSISICLIIPIIFLHFGSATNIKSTEAHVPSVAAAFIPHICSKQLALLCTQSIDALWESRGCIAVKVHLGF